MCKGEILNCETINSESMCTLIKAKWRKNLDKKTRNLFYHFSGVILKNDFTCFCALFNAEKSSLRIRGRTEEKRSQAQ